ncbi:MAG TPA: methyltransferase domain-containing protein [Gemmatimonadaceae bacterium]|nr:methyltransferase domain-containing protein [Gemmatimonadaceae bacterium]
MTETYDDTYRDFDSPLMRRVRTEAYGEDIGQHSWVTADELRSDIGRLSLTPSSRLLDLGAGPCGPLTFILHHAGCSGVAADQSASGLDVGRERARALGVDAQFSTRQADLNDPLPFDDASFDAAISLDVVLHLRDRARLFREVARVLRPGGRFLLTDAGVITGPISNEEVEARSGYGFTQFSPAGLDERLLEQSGFRVVETRDRTASVVRNAGGRLGAMRTHRTELEDAIGTAAFERQQDYLAICLALAERRAMSRVMVLAERR